MLSHDNVDSGEPECDNCKSELVEVGKKTHCTLLYICCINVDRRSMTKQKCSHWFALRTTSILH